MIDKRWFSVVAVALSILLLSPPRATAESFQELLGNVSVGSVRSGGKLEVPYITWGGDVATFHANGGLNTAKGSILSKQGLDLRLVAGDDFVAQVRRYLEGKTPFLRGTFRMLGMASEVIGRDPRTRPVVFLQLTWSQGDHMVGRPSIRTVNVLKGKKVTLQQGGPHVGMLDDILRSAALSWSDIEVVWAKELTGQNGPAAMFRKDSSIDACMVISPDMIGLTSGLEAEGTGAEGTVKAARVVVSTFNMNRSIADVYACRKDFYDANRGTVEKFAAGYLRGCEDVATMKQDFQKRGSSPDYSKVLQMTQQIFGSDVIPNATEADGLISDCEFVHLRGNRLFFLEEGFPEGFARKMAKATELAVTQGYAAKAAPFIQHDLDYAALTKLGQLTKTALGESVEFSPVEVEDEDTILSFTIQFQPNQTKFPVAEYAAEFQRVVDSVGLYGNSVFAIRGHADPTRTLRDFVRAGIQKSALKRTGKRGNYRYFFRGKPLDLNQTEAIVQLVESGAFAGGEPDPSQTLQAARNLSQQRAEEVRRTIIAYAREKDLRLNETALQAVGVGIGDPVVAKPRSVEESRENMRVEFRLLRVTAEASQASEFDF